MRGQRQDAAGRAGRRAAAARPEKRLRGSGGLKVGFRAGTRCAVYKVLGGRFGGSGRENAGGGAHECAK
jgi:hypothetical protein